jgi:preprotein translocase subunit SecE
MAVKNVVQFFHEVKIELSKVEWPSFDEWVGSTIIVLFLVGVFAVYLGVIDFGFSRLAAYAIRMFSGF